MKVDRETAYLLSLDPKRDSIVWLRAGRCTGSWLGGPKGCGHVVRIFYIEPHRPSWLQRKLGLARSRRFGLAWPSMPTGAVCPVCAARYPFAFYKLKRDTSFVPTPAQEADIRALYADLKRMAREQVAGREPTPRYGKTPDTIVELHSLAPPKTVDVGDAPDP